MRAGLCCPGAGAPSTGAAWDLTQKCVPPLRACPWLGLADRAYAAGVAGVQRDCLGDELPQGFKAASLLGAQSSLAKTVAAASSPCQCSSAAHHRTGAAGDVQISRRMQEEAQGGSGSQPRLLLYSGHDTTIMPLLVMLGEDTLDWPPYCSNLVFELWETSGWLSKSYTVRVLYNRQTLQATGPAGEPGLVGGTGSNCMPGHWGLHVRLCSRAHVEVSFAAVRCRQWDAPEDFLRQQTARGAASVHLRL